MTPTDPTRDTMPSAVHVGAPGTAQIIAAAEEGRDE